MTRLQLVTASWSNAESDRNSGYTLVEIVVAIVVFTVGALALTASSALTARSMARNAERERAARIGVSRIELVRSQCVIATSGAETLEQLQSDWVVTRGTSMITVTESVRCLGPCRARRATARLSGAGRERREKRTLAGRAAGGDGDRRRIRGAVTVTLNRPAALLYSAAELHYVRENVRDAMEVLSTDIRGMSLADTVRLGADSAIDFFANIGSSVVCQINGTDVGCQPRTPRGAR